MELPPSADVDIEYHLHPLHEYQCSSQVVFSLDHHFRNISLMSVAASTKLNLKAALLVQFGPHAALYRNENTVACPHNCCLPLTSVYTSTSSKACRKPNKNIFEGFLDMDEKETGQKDKVKMAAVSSVTMELTDEFFDALKTEKEPEEKTLKVNDSLELVYREVVPASSNFDVLFLHEAKGKSKKPDAMENGEFIKKAIAALKLDKPVIISPSMSGGYSLPYLFNEPATVLERSRGFVPVAPVSTAEYKDKFKDAKIPTLIIYGENDKVIGPEALKNLKNLPSIKMEVKLEAAGHACYMNKPKDFNKKLVEFLKQL
ncbi:ABHEA-like protein [Mya arenaria]|uniref:ABHEA-like protein n=1 Tax=Mya arenaria TaxID=6604 RepID=A0ABY7GBX1_MYAAR|nr:ABHEA-like protein [Mya arenaria]